MPFPFPSAKAGITVDECVRRFPERAGSSCEEGWRGRERVVAGVVMGVAVGTFVWMVCNTWIRCEVRWAVLILLLGCHHRHPSDPSFLGERIIASPST